MDHWIGNLTSEEDEHESAENAGDGWSWGANPLELAEVMDGEGDADRPGSEGDGEDEDEEAGGVYRDKVVWREWVRE